jgi:homoserine kinase
LAVAAAAAAGAKDPLAVATQVDGHPDNAAASMVGGLIAATMVRGGVRVVRLTLDVSLVFVVIVPDLSLSTSKARQVLPPEVNREHAAFNLGRLAFLIAGLADSRVLLSEATEDRLHQDYRSPLFPAAPQLLSGLSRAGALAVCWSGAGPALLGICKGSEGAKVRAATQEVMAEIQVPGEVLLLRPDMHGLVVDKSGSGDFWKDRKPTWLADEPEPAGVTRDPDGNGKPNGNGTDKGKDKPKSNGADDGNQFYDFDTDN